ncbi:MAG: ATP-binding protein [Acidimicrobiia bacterium]
MVNVDLSPANLADRAPVGLFALAPDGHPLYANRAFRSLCGDGLLGRVHPDQVGDLRTALAARRDVDARFQVFAADGDTRWIHVIAAWRAEPTAMLAGVVVDITVLVEELENVRRARDEALRAATMKDEFLAAVSHEIRTPMNAVVNVAALLLDSGLNEEQREHLATMQTAGAHLLGLLNDILDLSRIGTGRLLVEEADFELLALLDDVGRMFTPTALEKGLRLRIDTDTSLPRWVKGDALRVRQILVNLVGNAIKFTAQGSVTIGATAPIAGAPTVRFEVRDTGPGIPASMHEAVFEAFVQGDGSTARLKGGSGLGLTICRQLIGLMGGSMGLLSEPDAGATFWFVVTFAPASPQDVAVSPPYAPGSKGRILLAEDNAVNQKVALSLLTRLGYAVDVVGDGVAALEALRSNGPFDCLIVDVHMPELDGYETAQRVRAIERTTGVPRLPILALTGAARGVDHDRCLAAGMDDHLTKPIDLERLAAVLDRVMNVSPARSEAYAPVDPRVIDNLRSLPGSNGTLLDDVVDAFTATCNQRLDELSTQLVADHWTEAAREAHTLRGMAVDLGAGRLAELCNQLENLCRAPAPPDGPDAAALLRDLRDELIRVSGALAA